MWNNDASRHSLSARSIDNTKSFGYVSSKYLSVMPTTTVRQNDLNPTVKDRHQRNVEALWRDMVNPFATESRRKNPFSVIYDEHTINEMKNYHHNNRYARVKEDFLFNAGEYIKKDVHHLNTLLTLTSGGDLNNIKRNKNFRESILFFLKELTEPLDSTMDLTYSFLSLKPHEKYYYLPEYLEHILPYKIMTYRKFDDNWFLRGLKGIEYLPNELFALMRDFTPTNQKNALTLIRKSMIKGLESGMPEQKDDGLHRIEWVLNRTRRLLDIKKYIDYTILVQGDVHLEKDDIKRPILIWTTGNNIKSPTILKRIFEELDLMGIRKKDRDKLLLYYTGKWNKNIAQTQRNYKHYLASIIDKVSYNRIKKNSIDANISKVKVLENISIPSHRNLIEQIGMIGDSLGTTAHLLPPKATMMLYIKHFSNIPSVNNFVDGAFILPNFSDYQSYIGYTDEDFKSNFSPVEQKEHYNLFLKFKQELRKGASENGLKIDD